MASFFSTLFGGGAEREAADRNRQAYGLYNTTATNALDQGLSRSVGAVTDANSRAGDYLGRNYDLYGDLRTTGNNILTTDMSASLAALGGGRERALGAYDPLAALGTKYGAGTD